MSLSFFRYGIAALVLLAFMVAGRGIVRMTRRDTMAISLLGVFSRSDSSATSSSPGPGPLIPAVIEFDRYGPIPACRSTLFSKACR